MTGWLFNKWLILKYWVFDKRGWDNFGINIFGYHQCCEQFLAISSIRIDQNYTRKMINCRHQIRIIFQIYEIIFDYKKFFLIHDYTGSFLVRIERPILKDRKLIDLLRLVDQKSKNPKISFGLLLV